MNTLKICLITTVLFLAGCGHQGSVGANGAQGIQGNTGAQGPAPTMIQFCPGFTPTYPSVFPEVALCVNGSLYAILDPSNSVDYLTLIPPGAYSSTATGASCSFTVLANCQIQN